MPQPAKCKTRRRSWPLLAALYLLYAGLALTLGTASGACKDSGSKKLLEDASFGRRVFMPPPTGEVRALPPHNIHGRGVGPYELFASFQKTLALLPNGPRVERFESEGLFDYRLMRTDNDALLLGVGRSNRLNFISVLDPDIARTESGIGVGAGVEELIGALGAVRVAKDGGRDPRIVTFTALPDTRFIVEGGKVVAAVVLEPDGEDARAKEGEGDEAVESPCRASELKERKDEVLALAGFAPAPTAVIWSCLLSDSGEALVRSGEWLKVVGKQGGEGALRVLAKHRLPGLRFAALLNTGGERPSIYTVVGRRDAKRSEIVVSRHKLAGGRMIPVWTRTPLKLRASSASWLGAKLEETDFYVELRGRDRMVEVGGIFVQHRKGSLRNVVPVASVELVDSRPDRRTESPESPGARADAGPKTEAKPVSDAPANRSKAPRVPTTRP